MRRFLIQHTNKQEKYETFFVLHKIEKKSDCLYIHTATRYTHYIRTTRSGGLKKLLSKIYNDKSVFLCFKALSVFLSQKKKYLHIIYDVTKENPSLYIYQKKKWYNYAAAWRPLLQKILLVVFKFSLHNLCERDVFEPTNKKRKNDFRLWFKKGKFKYTWKNARYYMNIGQI